MLYKKSLNYYKQAIGLYTYTTLMHIYALMAHKLYTYATNVMF